MRPPSIGVRLAAWYFLVSACAIGGSSTAAWFAMRASLYQAVDDELRDRVRGVQTFMDLQISALSTPEIRDEFREHSVLGPGGDLFQVCDAQGEWLYRSGPLEKANMPIPLPGQLQAPGFENRIIDRHRLRFYSQRLLVNGKPYTVQVASVLDEGFDALEKFRVSLFLAGPVFLLAASIGGYWLSKRALSPVDRIAGAARRIGIENLTERLEVPQTGDQLQSLSETLNEMLAGIETSVRRIRQFTADASHELRAPLSLIRTTAEVTVQRAREPEEYRRALIEILEESERTSLMLDALMLLARADSGMETLESAPFDLCAAAREASEQGAKLAHTRTLSLALRTSKESLPVRGDADAIRRALLILIDNAVRYTPEGGSIMIEPFRDGDEVGVSVTDTGIGIAEADCARVFDRFWRADKARSREDSGAGLGLSIARWIVETHGGSVALESRVGEGSTFSIRLPRAVPESK